MARPAAAAAPMARPAAAAVPMAKPAAAGVAMKRPAVEIDELNVMKKPATLRNQRVKVLPSSTGVIMDALQKMRVQPSPSTPVAKSAEAERRLRLYGE
eukprot:1959144-Karenia_brevis.AAC.1